MANWQHHANCDPDAAGCYISAGKFLGIRMRIGPPSSAGLSYMRGVYTEPLDRQRSHALTSAYFKERSKLDNDPFKPDCGSVAGIIRIMPRWLKIAWVICGLGWLFIFLARVY